MSKNIVLLLTATIDPRGVSIARKNKEDRLNDYIKALQGWINNSQVKKIVFCENSNSDLTRLKNLCLDLPAEKSIEFLSFDGLIDPPERGIGFGEMLIIEYAFKNSKLLSTADFVIKVTGRLYVRNINKLIVAVEKSQYIDIWCDYRRYLTSTVSFIFCAKVSYFQKYIIPFKNKVDERYKKSNFEHALANAIHTSMAAAHHWRPLPFTPRITGISASRNRAYNSSLLFWIFREIYRKTREAVLER